MLYEAETVYIDKLQKGDHVILFYLNSTHKQQVLFKFLNKGLNLDEGAVYIAGDESPERISKAMYDFGFDVKSLEKEGKLRIVHNNKWYTVNGKFEIPNIMSLLKKTYEDALEIGLTGLRVCGEIDYFIQNDLEKLIEYEKNCGRKLWIPITALCAYKLDRVKDLRAKFFLELVKSHNQIFSPSFIGSFDFDIFYQQVLPEELKGSFGDVKSKKIISFINKWGQILDDDNDLNNVLIDVIGSKAERVEERIQQKLFKKFGVKYPKHLEKMVHESV